MTTNSHLSTTEPKKQNQKQTEQTTRTGTESQKWRSHEMISERRERRGNGRKGTGNKKHKWQVQNRQREVKNSRGNRKAKELICMTHGHELSRGGGNAGGWRTAGGGG